MATFTELLPAQVTSKHNAMKWTPAAGGAGELEIVGTRTRAVYHVRELVTAEAGIALELTKANGELYTVFCARNGQDASCTCKGFTLGHHTCKHIAAARALLENDWLQGGQEVHEVNPSDCPF